MQPRILSSLPRGRSSRRPARRPAPPCAPPPGAAARPELPNPVGWEIVPIPLRPKEIQRNCPERYWRRRRRSDELQESASRTRPGAGRGATRGLFTWCLLIVLVIVWRRNRAHEGGRGRHRVSASDPHYGTILRRQSARNSSNPRRLAGESGGPAPYK